MKLGILLTFVSLGLFMHDFIYPTGCGFCFWQRILLGVMGVFVILNGRFKNNNFLLLLMISLAGVGIVIAWLHLELYFREQVMHLSQLMQIYGQAGSDQKALVRDAIENEMTLHWALKAMPLWSLILFMGLEGYTLSAFLRRASCGF